MQPRTRWMWSMGSLAALVLLVGLRVKRIGDQLHGAGNDDPQAVAEADLDRFSRGLMMYRRAHGDFPSPIEGLAALAPEVLPKIPLDPWGRRYRYERVGPTVVLSTMGADGRPGGDQDNADLSVSVEPP